MLCQVSNIVYSSWKLCDVLLHPQNKLPYHLRLVLVLILIGMAFIGFTHNAHLAYHIWQVVLNAII